MIGKVRRKNLKSAIVCLTWAQLSNVHLRKMNTMVSFKICFTISKSRKNKGYWPIPALCLFPCSPTVICPLWRPFQTYSWQWRRWWQWCYIDLTLMLHCYTTLLLHCFYIATTLLSGWADICVSTGITGFFSSPQFFSMQMLARIKLRTIRPVSTEITATCFKLQKLLPTLPEYLKQYFLFSSGLKQISYKSFVESEINST